MKLNSINLFLIVKIKGLFVYEYLKLCSEFINRCILSTVNS